MSDVKSKISKELLLKFALSNELDLTSFVLKLKNAEQARQRLSSRAVKFRSLEKA